MTRGGRAGGCALAAPSVDAPGAPAALGGGGAASGAPAVALVGVYALGSPFAFGFGFGSVSAFRFVLALGSGGAWLRPSVTIAPATPMMRIAAKTIVAVERRFCGGARAAATGSIVLARGLGCV